MDLDPKEKEFQQLWKTYFKSTNIESRQNLKLHLKHVLKRYWKYLAVNDHEVISFEISIYHYFDPPNNLATIQIISATTTTTNKTPDHTPALNMPSTSEQLETSTNKLDISANGIIFFIIYLLKPFNWKYDNTEAKNVLQTK